MTESGAPTTSAPAVDDIAARITYLDVVEQQLASMKQQAIATIASCESAITTVQLLRAQFDAARKIAEERRRAMQSDEQKPPATFGARRRSPAPQGE